MRVEKHTQLPTRLEAAAAGLSLAGVALDDAVRVREQ